MKNVILVIMTIVAAANCQAGTIYVNADGTGDYPTIQDAINNANHGDVIILQPGTYTGNGNRDIDFSGKAITVRSTDPTDPCVVAGTVIDCQGHRGFYFHNGENSDSILDGLTITNGYNEAGGGICCEYSSPTVVNCVFRNNKAFGGMAGLGGAMQCSHSYVTITNCTFVENSADCGGGIDTYGGRPTITGCTFRLNSSSAVGGAMEISDTTGLTLVTGCTFIGNSTVYQGGGIYSQRTNLKVTNCTFSGNSSEQWYGGGAYDVSTLTNCTFIGNKAGVGGGGTANGNISLTLTNCILWNNSDAGGIDESAQMFNGSWNPAPFVNYCCIQGLTGALGGTGNIDGDPCFIDAYTDNFHLMLDSPCIDAGDPNYVVGPNETDLDGNPRIDRGRIDMGAFESVTYESSYLFFAVGWDGWFTHIDPILGQIEPIRSDLPSRLQALARSPNGIFYAGKEGSIYTIDPWTGDTEFVVSVNTDIRGMAFSPDGKLYVTSEWTTSFRLRTVDIETGNVQEVGVLWGDNQWAQGLAFSPDGVLYAITPNIFTDNTYELLTIDLDDCQMHSLGRYKNTSGVNQSLTFTPDGRLYALGNNSFAQLNPENGAIIGMPLSLHQGADEGEYRGLALVPTLSNIPPVAVAGTNQVAYAWLDGLAEVTLDGSGSYDEDSDELTYFWWWSIDGNNYEANGVSPTIELPVGEHQIELVVNDGFEDSEPSYTTVTVIGPIKGFLWLTPQMIISRQCPQRRIMATLRLPAGITRDQIDGSEKLTLYPGGIEAVNQCILPSYAYGVKSSVVFAYFDKDDVLDAIGGNRFVRVYAVGKLKTGQFYYGLNTLRIFNPRRWPRWGNMRQWFGNWNRHHPCIQNRR